MSLTTTDAISSAAPLAPPPANGATPRSRFDLSCVVGTMTVDEWDAFVRKAKHKHDYVHGWVVRRADCSPAHNLLASNFAFTVGNALEKVGNPCEVLGSDQRVFVKRGLYYFPDLVVFCGEALVDNRDAIQNPVALVEVLSPTTRDDDRGEKLQEYAQIETLRHYILIDQDTVAVTHYEKMNADTLTLTHEYRALSDVLTLTFGGKTVAVPLSRIYRNVPVVETA
ncbi:MAG: Uma2 family endonuclease [Armatimonadetes bacterium]|nr:Uma2 family endonuclease [Armatimonadota bacterium]